MGVGDLGVETAVEPVGDAGGRYRVVLSRDWEIWGPMGGYVASTALRAAGAHTAFPRPASIVGHFLGVAGFAPVEIETVTLRRAKRAESIRVSVTQAGNPIFEAMVWAVSDDLPEIAHEVAPPPPGTVPPLTHPTLDERLRAAGLEPDPPYPFWRNFESRPVTWSDDWEHREPAAPEWVEWLRFVPDPDTRDPWVDACRLLVLVDIGSWPAVTRLHVDPGGLYAPSIDLACHFHRLRPDSAHLLVRGSSPSGADGLVTSHQSVWADDGTFLASGIGQLLCRPVR